MKTIKELKDRKVQFEKEIQKLLDEFSKDYLVGVDSVSVIQTRMLSDGYHYIVEVNVGL